MRDLPYMSGLTKSRAIALVRGVYNMRHIGSTRFNDIAGPVTKICSFLLPIIMVTVPFAPALDNQGILCLILTCTPSTFSTMANTMPHPADAIITSALLLGRGQRLHRRHPRQIRPQRRQLPQNRRLQVHRPLGRDVLGQEVPRSAADGQMAAAALYFHLRGLEVSFSNNDKKKRTP